MELKEAVEQAIVECYGQSAIMHKGYALIELKKVISSDDPKFPIEEVDIKLVNGETALNYLDKWKKGEIQFDGFSFYNPESGPRVRYIITQDNHMKKSPYVQLDLLNKELYIRSRSHKKVKGICDRNPWAKKMANKKVRTIFDISSGSSYKKIYESYCICDYKFLYFNDEKEDAWWNTTKPWHWWMKQGNELAVQTVCFGSIQSGVRIPLSLNNRQRRLIMIVIRKLLKLICLDCDIKSLEKQEQAKKDRSNLRNEIAESYMWHQFT